MTLKQKFENINLMYWDEDGCYEAVIAHEESYKCVKIADDYALGFGDFCRNLIPTNNHIHRKYPYATLEELLEIYKKEKGL